MRRRQAILEREALRRSLNTEQAVETPPEPTPDEDAPKKRGRPRKVKDDDTP